MGVGEKTQDPLGTWQQTQDRSNVECLEHGIYRNAFAIRDSCFQVDRLVTTNDELHFGMWHPTEFNQMANWRGRTEAERKVPLTPLRRQEIVQLGIKAQDHRGHG